MIEIYIKLLWPVVVGGRIRNRTVSTSPLCIYLPTDVEKLFVRGVTKVMLGKPGRWIKNETGYEISVNSLARIITSKNRIKLVHIEVYKRGKFIVIRYFYGLFYLHGGKGKLQPVWIPHRHGNRRYYPHKYFFAGEYYCSGFMVLSYDEVIDITTGVTHYTTDGLTAVINYTPTSVKRYISLQHRVTAEPQDISYSGGIDNEIEDDWD